MDLVLYEKLAAYESCVVLGRHPGEGGGRSPHFQTCFLGSTARSCGLAEPKAFPVLFTGVAPGHLWPGAIPAGFSCLLSSLKPGPFPRDRR